MGDPKKFRKKYESPRHPWNKTAIETERVLVREYGLKKKLEIFIANSYLRRYKNLAKHLIATKTVQAEKEKTQILGKLHHKGFLSAGAGLDEILGLGLKDVLERRLQSQVARHGLARSMSQARQFITHRHILVGNKEITSPSYLVSRAEESLIQFKLNSALSAAEHPERVTLVREAKAEQAAEKKEARDTRNKETRGRRRVVRKQ